MSAMGTKRTFVSSEPMSDFSRALSKRSTAYYHSEMEENLYLELTTILALNTFSRCVYDATGHPVYEHFSENRLEVPPDILARLGVMRPEVPDQWMGSSRHFFSNGWTPRQPLVLKRHSGEPSIFDLIVAVCLIVEWDGRNVREGISELTVPPASEFPDLDLSDSTRFNSEPQLTFCDLAFCKAANRLELLGLGHWNECGQFELISSLLENSPIDLADTYDETRYVTAQRLGGVEYLFPPI